MKKEYFKPEIEVVKLASESIADVTTLSTQTQTKIYTLNFTSNLVEDY